MLWLAGLVALGGFVTVNYVVVRVLDAFAHKWSMDRQMQLQAADADRTMEARRVTVLERDVTLKEEAAKRPIGTEPMPDDLRVRILSWEDGFAQENEESTIRSLYAELGDWERVRHQLVPLPTGTPTDDIRAPRDGLVA